MCETDRHTEMVSKVTWLRLLYRGICIPSWHGQLSCRYRRGSQWGSGGHPTT